MKTLVFGYNGQVATHLRAFEGVHALNRVTADLSDPEACADIIARTDADIVINAAAYTAVDKAETEEDIANTINGVAPGQMARASAKRGIPFFHISTDYVFPGSGKTAWKTSESVAPLGAYGRSKRMGEEGVIHSGAAYIILRTAWVFSAYGNNFVRTMLKLANERDNLSVVDDQIGGPTAAEDIAAALMQIARIFYEGRGKSGIYHFSGAPAISWHGFAQNIFAMAGQEITLTGIPSSHYPTPAKRPLNSRLDCSDILRDYAIVQPDWRISLRRVLDCLLKKPNQN